jgi:ketosteroid isomerase-like protein
MTTTTATRKDVVQKVNDAFASNRLEDFLACCADDVEWVMVGDRTVKGKDEIRKWMGSVPAEPPRFEVDAIVAEGDYVVCYGDMTMKEGSDNVPYSYCDTYRFEGDQIKEMRSYVIKTAGK